MRLPTILSTALSTLALLSPALASVVAKRASSFQVVSGPKFTFQYSTSEPNDQNWIGIYSVYGSGPGKEDSLYWDWMPGSSGTRRVDDANLNWGAYKAYYLARNGYDVLAGPIDIFLFGDGSPIYFNLKTFTTRNARQGDAFSHRVNGLLHHAPDAKTKYRKDGGAAWVNVSEGGTISGTPTGSGTSKITLRATASDGSSATLEVNIPVVARGQPLVTDLKVLSMNLWYGGLKVDDYNRKQISAVQTSGADLVGFQESTWGHSTQIADALGWYSWQGKDVGIISRYPIAQKYGAINDISGGVRVALDGDASQAILYNCHPAAYPYGPYEPCFNGKGADAISSTEQSSGRVGQIKQIIGAMQGALSNADKIPVLLTGDFNAPSHLDWTDATRGSHCGVGRFDWPTSKVPTDAGMRDSYREVHPNPASDPANTWSPIYLDNEGRKEPMDRIDFVYYKGGLKPTASEIFMIGQPKAEPNHFNNEWPTDHKAVLTTFRIQR